MNSKLTLYLFIILINIQLNAFSQNLDLDILKAVNKNETGFKNAYLGFNASAVNTIGIAVPVVIAAAGFISHNKLLKQDALYISGSILVSSLLTLSTKHIVNRKRPFYKYDFIVKRDNEDYWLSFPSGHTSAAFCTATSISLRYPKWYVIVPAVIYAASVGWARVYQGVHYPTDVLTGSLVGAASAWLGYKAQKWVTGKKQRKKKLTL
jgi:membrane-associated phospholipid phosphatase